MAPVVVPPGDEPSLSPAIRALAASTDAIDGTTDKPRLAGTTRPALVRHTTMVFFSPVVTAVIAVLTTVNSTLGGKRKWLR